LTLEKIRQIGIDVRMAQYTGIGRYIRSLVSKLDRRSQHFQFTLVGDPKSNKEFPPEFQFIPTRIPIYSFREQITLPQIIRFVDCLHVPHYNAPIFWRKKLVVTIHDLIHLHFSEHLSPLVRLYAQTMLPQIVRRADAIIAVSEYTKKDLIRTFGTQENKITVIHHGIDPSFLISEEKGNEISENRERYFLYVGLLKAHKNISVLLEAFRSLKNKLNLPDLKLRLVGVPDEKQKIVRQWLDAIKTQNDILLTKSVTDEQLKEFYRNAVALVLPSFYEGFGFPLLEAMAAQTPIIASHTASIPEVLGGTAGLLFDPYSALELQNCMERILMNSDLRQKLVQEGLKRLDFFNWDIAARKTEQVYDTVLGSN